MRASTGCSSPPSPARASTAGRCARRRAPKRENVRYYASAAAAEAAGFRPCLRCRPELAPGHHRLAARRTRGGARAEADRRRRAGGALAGGAGRARGRRRAAVAAAVRGAPGRPADRRAHHAAAAVCQAAADRDRAAGDRGGAGVRLRQPAPVQCRVSRRPTGSPPTRAAPATARAPPATRWCLRLGYRPPYDFDALLAFLRTRALPGVEQVDEHSYARVFGAADCAGLAAPERLARRRARAAAGAALPATGAAAAAW